MKTAMLVKLSCLLLLSLPAIFGSEANAAPPRQTLSLNGQWEFQRDKAASWKAVDVPSSFQAHEGTNFHGVGWYRKAIQPFSVPAGKRVLLHFQAAATEAEVWWNGERLGTHSGAWTPFRFDITEWVRKNPPGRPHELRVRLDEKVGHNTQGFLPIIAPHFGGLWQDVTLLIVPETYIDDLQVLAIGDCKTGELRLDVPLAGAPTAIDRVALRLRLRGESNWTDLTPAAARAGDKLLIRVPVVHPRFWSPTEPNLYEVELVLPGSEGDLVLTRAAFRSIETFGAQFRLNGQPLGIRGLLNWGYSAPRVEPNPGEAVWREEIQSAKTLGFNLMKFCLWVPPQRYLELADEMGMLTWMEYPTWHPDFSEKFLEPLRREFREFFQYDRNHPSIILRSLTCETGPSAQLKVIQSLYDAAHESIPDALVEDDSSWIGWNRVHDFYDDHPYGNNHTWVKTLTGFNEYILGHGLKPLVLGETTSADTWVDREALLARLGDQRPWWAPGVLDDAGRWLERWRSQAGPAGLPELGPDSLRYGLLMRKYQIEAFRRELPYGGYVISVLRDFPNASMGLLDYLGRPKWTEADWSWQRDTLCLLKTESDCRSFAAGRRLRGEILLSHFGLQPIRGGQFDLSLQTAGDHGQPLQQSHQKDLEQNPGTLASVATFDWPAPEVSVPTRLILQAALNTTNGNYRNEWSIWIMPTNAPGMLEGVQIHSSLKASLRQELFPGCSDFLGLPPAKSGAEPIVVASHFDDALVRVLEQGGKVLLLPDGQPHSLPLSAHWFLRGAPYVPGHPLNRRIPHDLLVELQHFDLAADVIPNLPQPDACDPILLLWDTHDQKTVKTHGIVFETRAARGRLLVSAARHAGTDNAAGRWLLAMLLDHLRSGPAPQHALSQDVWDYLKAKLHAEQTNLVSRAWKFKPDPRNEGLAQGWHLPTLASEPDWKDIRIDAWWESQGYPDLDGWAWYRLQVAIPASWQGRDIFLSFEGVDDIYELYVNGQLAGKGGDLATHQDALNEKKSHHISRFVNPGQPALIAVRVHDWYGAGGIFRPVTLGTLPFNPSLDLLK